MHEQTNERTNEQPYSTSEETSPESDAREHEPKAAAGTNPNPGHVTRDEWLHDQATRRGVNIQELLEQATQFNLTPTACTCDQPYCDGWAWRRPQPQPRTIELPLTRSPRG